MLDRLTPWKQSILSPPKSKVQHANHITTAADEKITSFSLIVSIYRYFPDFMFTFLSLPSFSNYLRHSQTFDSTLLVHHFACERVRRAPAQFDSVALAGLDALHADGLGDALFLLWVQAAAGLGVEFEGVALENGVLVRCTCGKDFVHFRSRIVGLPL